jgi:hypothetical protein
MLSGILNSPEWKSSDGDRAPRGSKVREVLSRQTGGATGTRRTTSNNKNKKHHTTWSTTLLVLGLPRSGRRTLLRTLAESYPSDSPHYSDRIRDAYRVMIRDTVLADVSKVLGSIRYDEMKSDLQYIAPLVQLQNRLREEPDNFTVFSTHADYLLAHPAFLKAFTELDHTEGGLMYCTKYFVFQRLQALSAIDYSPSQRDVLVFLQGNKNVGDMTVRLNIRESYRVLEFICPRKVNSPDFQEVWLDFSEKQIHCPIFIVDCSCFDIFDDEGVSLLKKSERMFKKLMLTLHESTKDVILMLTKSQLLKTKIENDIEQATFRSVFEDYQGSDSNAEQIMRYIMERFARHCSRTLYCHKLDADDRKALETILGFINLSLVNDVTEDMELE